MINTLLMAAMDVITGVLLLALTVGLKIVSGTLTVVVFVFFSFV